MGDASRAKAHFGWSPSVSFKVNSELLAQIYGNCNFSNTFNPKVNFYGFMF